MKFWLWLKDLFSKTPAGVWYVLMLDENGKPFVAGEINGTEEEANEEAGTVVVNYMFHSGAFSKGAPVHSSYCVGSKKEWDVSQKEVP